MLRPGRCWTLLQLQPDHSEALYDLGVCASEEGQLDDASQPLRHAVAANIGKADADADAEVALGLAALGQEERAVARRSLEA